MEENLQLFVQFRGFLMEVNERLLAEPNLIQQQVHFTFTLIELKGLTEGYVAIITPKIPDRDAIKSGKLTLEEYNKFRNRK